MIDLYYWPTPNGWKITILFEELGLNYRIVPVDILRGDQFDEEFLKIGPNNKMPVVVDSQGPNNKPITIFESGAILLHYAELSRKFIPLDIGARSEVIEWLFFQMAHVGPMLGQNHHFRVYATEKIPYAIDRYTKEAARIYGVINKRLKGRDFICDNYSIVDMAIYPWLRGHEKQGQSLDDFPDIKRWYSTMSDRPAVQKGLAVLKDKRKDASDFTDEQRSVMFGDKQFEIQDS